MRKNLICDIVKGSIAEEMEIEAGDYLVAINGEEIRDILDYKFQIFDEFITITIQKASGEEWDLEIEKEVNEDLGLIFPEQLIEKAKSCANHCIFCFMDQLPKQVRDTLIFKDDDFRLSFLTGNYVTLTNSGYRDLERVVKYHLSPINISVHTTDGELRKRMLNNKNADKILEYIDYLTQNGIQLNAQIVLCPGINDGAYLDKTILDLSYYFPHLLCIAIVPVGLSKYREGLYPLKGFTKESSQKVIDQVAKWQQKFKKEIGSNVVYLADEFYVQAQYPIPPYQHYEDFPQLEDGIGMLAFFTEQFNRSYRHRKSKKISKSVSIATGKIAYAFIREKADFLEKKYPGLKIYVYAIENHFFGSNITVTGLITGSDLIRELKGKPLGQYLLISTAMLKDDEPIFLDDVSLEEVENALKIKIVPTPNNGKDFMDKIVTDLV